MEQRLLRLGAAIIGGALCLWLVCAVFLQPLPWVLQRQELLSFLVYLETGRHLRYFGDIPEETQPPLAETPPKEDFDIPAFQEAELAGLMVQDLAGRQPDLPALLTAPLKWDLTQGEPAVLILHTHATEGFAGVENYRSLDEEENMLSIGAEVARLLESAGIGVIQDRSLHDYPDYNSAYNSSRSSVQDYLDRYPTIRVVLDLHRDAAAAGEEQLVTSAVVGGQRSAQLMMVVGTDTLSEHPYWQENLSLALKLSALLERENPGICRPLQLRRQRFNLDLSPGSLLSEVGAAGNTHEEAVIAAHALAQAIIALSRGTEMA